MAEKIARSFAELDLSAGLVAKELHEKEKRRHRALGELNWLGERQLLEKK